MKMKSHSHRFEYLKRNHLLVIALQELGFFKKFCSTFTCNTYCKLSESILRNQMRKDCVITHIPLRMNLYILHLTTQYINSFGEKYV